MISSSLIMIISMVLMIFNSPIVIGTLTSPSIPKDTHKELKSIDQNGPISSINIYRSKNFKRWLNTAFLPYFVDGSSIYGSFNDQPKSYWPRYSFGPEKFYTQTLPSYLVWSQNGGGIYGFGASFDFRVNEFGKTVPNPSSYSFFKSVNENGKGKNLGARSLKHIGKRDDNVQCKNQKGQPSLFSRSDCEAAAMKMVNQKSAISNSGNCGLVLVGPQGQLSSSNLPVDKIQNDVQNILNACQNGPSNTPNGQYNNYNYNNKMINIPKDSNPTYVLLLIKG